MTATNHGSAIPRAAPTPEATTARCRICGATEREHEPGLSSVTACVAFRPEATGAPDWNRTVEVADEFLAALAVRNRGSGNQGPRTHTDSYAAWLHLKQVLAASRATVAALTAEREARDTHQQEQGG